MNQFCPPTGTIPARKVLLLLPFVPSRNGHHGGSRASAQLITTFCDRYSVGVLYLRGSAESDVDDQVLNRCDLVQEVEHPGTRASYGSRLLRRGFSLATCTPRWVADWTVASFAERLREISETWNPDVVQFEFHIMAQYVSALARSPAIRVLSQHEPGVLAAREHYEGTRGLRQALAYLDVQAWRRYERNAMQAMDAVVTFTERDRGELLPLAGHTSVVTIPLAIAVPEQGLDPVGSAQPNLLFVGYFGHPPNRRAAIRLMRSIFPRVRARCPETVLHVVGAGGSAALRDAAAPNIILTGRVPDTTPYLNRATVIVVPIDRGGGIRIKVLEALAAGKAIVASPLAVAGLDVTHEDQVLLASSDDEFVHAVIRLLEDADLRIGLAARAHAWALAKFNNARTLTAYDDLYEHAGRSRDRRLDLGSRATGSY